MKSKTQVQLKKKSKQKMPYHWLTEDEYNRNEIMLPICFFGGMTVGLFLPALLGFEHPIAYVISTVLGAFIGIWISANYFFF